MANGKKKTRKRKGFTLPLAVVAGIAPVIVGPIQHTMWHGPMGGVKELARITTGYDPTDGSFDFWRLKFGLLPALVGVAVHKVASMTGLNRAIANAGIPIFRI